MPLFAYQCKACAQTSELLVRGEEKPVCPNCGSDKLEKQMSHITPVQGRGAPPDCASCCSQAGSCSSRGSGASCCGL